MATLTDDDQKSQIDKNYEGGSGAYESAGLDQLEAHANDPKNHNADIKDAESNPNQLNYTGGGSSSLKGKTSGRLGGAKTFLKKKGSIIGIISILGVGGIGVGVFGPGSLLIAVTQNLTDINDSTSRTMNVRAKQVLGRLIKDPGSDGGVCASGKKIIKCKGSRISNKALKNLNKKGITALDVDGKPMKFSRTGYPKGGNPARYQIDLGNGKTAFVEAKDLKGFLTNNPKIGAKVFGRVGILNMRTKAIAGKSLKKFRDNFKIKRDGGVTNGKNKTNDSKAKRLADAKKEFKDSASKNEGGDVKERISKRTNAKVAGAKIGGGVYTAAYLGCLMTKAPSLIGGGVAAIQLARIMPVAMHFLMSPGSKLQASGEDEGNTMDDTDMDIAGSLLTDKTKDNNGNMKSALDSPLLLSAIGVNSNKVDPSKYGNYIPGYNIITNDFFKVARDAQKAAAPACSVIMSPVTMYAALAVTLAVSASTGGIGALGNLGISLIVGLAAGPFISSALDWGMKEALDIMAGEDILGSLQGIQFGHALGGSVIATFAAMGMARHLPTLPVSKLTSFKQVVDDEIAQERKYDTASLSPFDTSSPYTFLGSLTKSLRIGAIASGGYTGGLASLLGNVTRIPSSALSVTPNTIAAEGFNASMCDYAKTFDLETDGENGPTPAINIMGLPCTGITAEQASMDPEDAENILIERGWLDNEKENIPDDATIDDLVSSGVIVKETPLAAYIESCSDASTGDYLFEGAGCTVSDTVKSGSSSGEIGSFGCGEDDEGEQDCSERDALGDGNQAAEDNIAYQAMSVWLIDFQVAQSINGEDDEETSQTNTTSGEFEHPLKDKYGYEMYAGNDHLQGATDWWRPVGTPVYAIHSGTVTSFTYDTVYSGQMGVNHGDFSVNYTHIGPNPLVKVGDSIKAGQQIGVVGPAPAASPTIPHLHLGISKDPNNPWSYSQYYQSAKFLRDNGVDPGPCGEAAGPALIGLPPNGTGACHYAG